VKPTKPKLTERESFSAPAGFYGDFDAHWQRLGFEDRSKFFRALFEAAKHYELRSALHPETGDRVLRTLADIKAETFGGRHGSEASK
jgi:hypothetical protein